MVDDSRIALRPAVELSYLTVEQQKDLIYTIESEDTTPSLAQAIEMKKISQRIADFLFFIDKPRPNRQREGEKSCLQTSSFITFIITARAARRLNSRDDRYP